MTKPGYGIECTVCSSAEYRLSTATGEDATSLEEEKIRREDMDTRALGSIPELYLGLFSLLDDTSLSNLRQTIGRQHFATANALGV